MEERTEEGVTKIEIAVDGANDPSRVARLTAEQLKKLRMNSGMVHIVMARNMRDGEVAHELGRFPEEHGAQMFAAKLDERWWYDVRIEPRQECYEPRTIAELR